MYGQLLAMAYRQERASRPAASSPEAAAVRLLALQARLGELDGRGNPDPVVRGTTEMLAYDLALIDACASAGISHRLLDEAGAAERRRVDEQLSAAGFDIKVLLTQAEPGAGR